MTVQRLFPTLVYSSHLKQTGWKAFNGRLLEECRQLRVDDVAGRSWSKCNYAGGYTSYSSVNRMHQVSPTFAELERRLRRHVLLFSRALAFDLEHRELSMTDCWVNIMPRQVVHGLHLHPLSSISGTYYVHTPNGCAGLKFEDPRLERFMAAPPRRAAPSRRATSRGRGNFLSRGPWAEFPARAGALLLFESWLRHEVPPNPVGGERISISFNYSWF